MRLKTNLKCFSERVQYRLRANGLSKEEESEYFLSFPVK